MDLEKLSLALRKYHVVLEPDRNEPEWWAGAPSVVHTQDGTFYLAVRMREGNSPRGRRGYEIRILESTDGIHFTPIKSIARDLTGVPGFERPALAIDPLTKKIKLYGCSPTDRGWAIWKLADVAHPKEFDPKTLHYVIDAPSSPDNQIITSGSSVDGDHHVLARVAGYKDPFVLWMGDHWILTVIGYDKVERPYIFTSSDGESWNLANPDPILESIGWHNFFTRPSCVLPLQVGFLLIYEGSHHTWFDPTYNIATGLAYSPDLKLFYDLSPRQPLVTTTTPGDYQTWRYSHWLIIDRELFVYFEAARPNRTNEIRMVKCPIDF
jgi:hypothetical protein